MSGTVRRLVRILPAMVIGFIAFMATMTGDCDAVEGVPAWERCTSWLGTPAFKEWRAGFWGDLLIPLGIGTATGVAVWWLLGRIPALGSEVTD